MHPEGNRQILLRRRPRGLLAKGDYELVVAGKPAEPGEGEAVVKTSMLAMDPVSRVMLGADIGIMPPLPLDTPIRGFGAGYVVASRCPDFPVGARIAGFFEWADYQSVRPGTHTRLLPDTVAFGQALNLYGHTAHAAYFGMLDVGQVSPGDIVVVTGAAGAVGSIAAQISRIKGAKTIGIAGSKEKCAWLTDNLKLDAAIDYRQDGIGAALQKCAPDGITLLFDNVGGPLRNTLLTNLAHGGRAVLCGATAQYLSDDPLAQSYDTALLKEKGAVAKHFNAMDYSQRFREASEEMTRWEQEGRLHVVTEITKGLEQAPWALNRLFEGHNRGRLLVDVENAG